VNALDTSVVVPALLTWHAAHDRCRPHAVGSAIPAHALLETFAVLTRLPAPHRLAITDAATLLTRRFPPIDRLPAPDDLQGQLIERLAAADISGGASYDALVALTAHHHGRVLLTRDRRAARTYRSLGIEFTMLAVG
jgi:predicted nucleic acid-binding protein